MKQLLTPLIAVYITCLVAGQGINVAVSAERPNVLFNPSAEWTDAVVSTVGRGTHSVSTDRWRYIRYFDGSEELYDMQDDPREWFNIANKPEQTKLKSRLAKNIREDNRFKQFVRWGRWKCVFPAAGDPMLFDYQGEFGISEQTDVAADHPEVVAGIRTYINQNQLGARRVFMPEQWYVSER